MARIYLDARAVSGVTSGVSRYCRGLIPELAAQAPWHEFIILRSRGTANTPLASSANAREVTVAGGAGTLPMLMSAPQLRGLFRRHGPADLFHALFHLLPFGVRQGAAAPKRVVVTLHDLIWIDYSRAVERTALAAGWRRRLGMLAIPHALRTADHVICNSDATAHSADRWIVRERCTTIHLGVDEDFFRPEMPAAAGRVNVPQPYIAAFGVPKAYKNIQSLVYAFRLLCDAWPALRLVLVGGDGGARQDIQRAGLSARVMITGALSDREVRDVIRRAEVFVVPSIVEGFGLPAVEAMALATPVLVSNAPALREIVGSAALTFEASDPADLASVLGRLLADEPLRGEMAARGQLRARQFRWPHAAARTLAVYDQLLRGECGVAARASSGRS